MDKSVYKSIKGMPIGVKDLNNGYAKLVDPIREYMETMITTYNDAMDRYIFKELTTENNYIHVEDPDYGPIYSTNVHKINFSYRMIATKTTERVFTKEKDTIDLQSLRTYLYEYQVDYKNMTFEELKLAMNRILK